MNPFPDEWNSSLKKILLGVDEKLCPVQFVTFSSGSFPETRTVLLRYLGSKDSIFVCTNRNYPKWEQVEQDPHVALSTYLPDEHLAFRLRARAECLDHQTEFSKEAWQSMPQLHQRKYLSMEVAETSGPSGVATIYGCIRLDPESWIIDQTGSDDWIKKRQIYERSAGGWIKTNEVAFGADVNPE